MSSEARASERTVVLGDPGVLGAGCPVPRLLGVVGDKWTPIVVYCLSMGVWRFGDLRSCIPDISKKMLTQVLRRLEAEGLVERRVYPTAPPATDYRLTPLGRTLHEPLRMLCHWAEANTHVLERIDRARSGAARAED